MFNEIEVIGLYLENISNGRRLMEAARKSRKPVLLYKVGKTKESARAAMSHTAGMANNDRVFDAACRRTSTFSKFFWPRTKWTAFCRC